MKEEYLRQLGAYAKMADSVGGMARAIIAQFVKEKGGSYDFGEDSRDRAWIDDEVYATSLKADSAGNILVYNSGYYSEYLHKMGCGRILEIAKYICES